MDQSVMSTPTQYNETTAPPSFVTMEEVSTSEMEKGAILRAELVRKLWKNSYSHQNFSARLVEVLFDKDTRKRSNVAGKMGKMRLNQILMDYVKSLAFQHFPSEEGERQSNEWVQCVVAIDEKNHQLKKTGRNPNAHDLL